MGTLMQSQICHKQRDAWQSTGLADYLQQERSGVTTNLSQITGPMPQIGISTIPLFENHLPTVFLQA